MSGYEGHGERVAVYVISVAAELSGMHPQTLRQYDRVGLVSPRRSAGRSRMYSIADISALVHIQELAALGVNLTGIKKILELERIVVSLESELSKLRSEKG